MKSKIIIGIIISGALIGTWAIADNRDNLQAPPHAIVRALQNIYEAILDLNADAPIREGYYEFFRVVLEPQETQSLITIPKGQKLVIRKIYAFGRYSERNVPPFYWSLRVDDRILLDGSVSLPIHETSWDNRNTDLNYIHDFPDECIVIKSNESLKAVNSSYRSTILFFTIIGYFEETDN